MTTTPTPDDITASESESDEAESQLERIADLLAGLSNPAQAPKGYKVAHDPFDKAAVDFSSNAWVLRVAAVQAWLCLELSLDAETVETKPAVAVERLFRGMS